MKKLIVTIIAVAIGVAAQAATYNWSNTYGMLDAYNAAGTDFTGTVYLMNDATMSQTAFVAAVLGGADYSKAFDTAVGSAFKSAANADVNAGLTFNSSAYTAGTVQNFYMVALDTANNGVYVSELSGGVTISDIGTLKVAFSHDAAYAGTVFGSDVKTFGGAGWYTAVPEPTSGLLMLVGLAGLALRRRRA